MSVTSYVNTRPTQGTPAASSCKDKVPRKREDSTADDMSLEEIYADLFTFIERDMDTSGRLAKKSITGLNEKVMGLAFAQAGIIAENKALRKQLEITNERVRKLEEENARLINEKTIAPTRTFAQALQTKKSNVQNTIGKVGSVPKTTLFITSKSGEDAKKVQATFTEKLDPTKSKIKVRAMRTAGKVLIVETNSEEDAKKIATHKELGKDLKCEPPKKRRPLMIIYDVPRDQSEEVVMRALYEQNLSENITREDFDEMVRMRFLTGPRNKPIVNYVIEMDPKLRRVLLQQGSLRGLQIFKYSGLYCGNAV